MAEPSINGKRRFKITQATCWDWANFARAANVFGVRPTEGCGQFMERAVVVFYGDGRGSESNLRLED